MARLQRGNAVILGIVAAAAATAACATYQPPILSYLSESLSLAPVYSSRAVPAPLDAIPPTEVSYVAPPTPSPSPFLVEQPALMPTPMPTPSPLDIEPSAPAPVPAPTLEADVPDVVPDPQPGAALQVPVQGVRPEQLLDTYTQARSEGRTHDALDIPAPSGTPVVAAAGGRVLKLFQSKRGGKTLYIRGTDNRTIYYYAHLAGYAPDIAKGKFVPRGKVIGYVGDTGNSGKGNFHLHFGISRTETPEKFYGGESVNPYPLLRNAP